MAEIPRILEPLWPKIGQQQGGKARMGGAGGVERKEREKEEVSFEEEQGRLEKSNSAFQR